MGEFTHTYRKVQRKARAPNQAQIVVSSPAGTATQNASTSEIRKQGLCLGRN